MKNDRGEITIMMVITVIVLIILGGICIFMLTGENGIFVLKTDQTTTNNTINTNQTNETTNNVVNNEVQESTNNTAIQNETQGQNITNNVNGALTVPIQ